MKRPRGVCGHLTPTNMSILIFRVPVVFFLFFILHGDVYTYWIGVPSEH
jgi:hypothetical protein